MRRQAISSDNDGESLFRPPESAPAAIITPWSDGPGNPSLLAPTLEVTFRGFMLAFKDLVRAINKKFPAGLFPSSRRGSVYSSPLLIVEYII